jgi:parallel beta-helix repeat protein
MAFSPNFRRGARLSGTVVGVATVAAVLALTGGEASAAHVRCGDTITADTTLDSDLVDCPNNGIVIGADDITLDLNGHTVDGDGELVEPCPENEFCDTGVANDGHDGVTVMHGSVGQFAVGVFVVNARHDRVLDISASQNRFFGIGLSDSARSTIRDSSAFRNGLDTHIEGISMFGSDHNRILHNSAGQNGDVGLFMARSDRNQIRENRMRGNREGGIGVEGDGNVISRNRVFRGGGGILISIFTDHGRAVGNVVRRNHVQGAGASGISVDPGPKRTLISRNHVRGAGADGINVLSRSTKLTRNRAVRNGDLGIDAVQGVIDGGGNRASGNGDARQCVNVTCH